MQQQELFGFRFDALGGRNEIQLYAKNRLEAEELSSGAIQLVEGIERKYSRYRSDSVVSLINASAGGDPIELDEEASALIDYSRSLYEQSLGLFDITSGVLRRIWDFKSHIIPTKSQIEDLLPLIGLQKVIWKRPFLRLPIAGMEIDLGGIGKEFAVDKVVSFLMAKGVASALVNLGGDIRITAPHPDGEPWVVGIVDPRGGPGAKPIYNLKVMSGAIATSGDYERYFIKDGIRYCHILNPKTGWPVNELRSVTVISEICMVAGGVSTIAMLFGGKKGPSFLKNLGLSFVIVGSNGEIQIGDLNV